MNAPVPVDILRQHLIDPEICIRCNTCEETCPIDAITHDGTNYVVMPDVCNGCMACVPPCPTGAIDNWRSVLKADAYSIDEQYTWDVLPEQGTMALPPSTEAPTQESVTSTDSTSQRARRCSLRARTARTRLSSTTRSMKG